ncbi:MAG: formylglycine-generating enzyme family protein [Psychroserpens sp.]|uniref:formylglycine-generating enzyme family protein n=1 Tax=Psychroserpens sp. TaxID=2020870 RepID=UPI0030025BDE
MKTTIIIKVVAFFVIPICLVLPAKDKYEVDQVQNVKEFNLTEGVRIKMIWVEPGSFMMGNSLMDQQSEINITKGFWLAETELTQVQWESVMKRNPSYHEGNDLPVDQVSFIDIMKFIERLNEQGGEFRLPTEAEWEYACRAGTKGTYYGDRDLSVWHSGNSGRQSHEVKQKRPNPWGFYDMQGNILESCSDWYQENIYTTKDQTDPIGPETGIYHVQRGGQFTGRIIHTEASNRQWSSPNKRLFWVGFRLAHDPLKN